MVAIPILLVIFGFVGFIVKWAMDHEQEKLRIMAGKANQDTMTESELQRMIEEAVEEAVAPLHARLARLEGDEAPAPLLSAEPRRLLDLDPEAIEFDDEADRRTRSARTRSRS